jgi:addiction module HigA family antidote
MSNPIHPGTLVKSEMDHLGRATAEAAAIGVTRQQPHKVITGRGSVTPEMALRLEQAIGGTADTWMQMQTNDDLAQVRQRVAGIKVVRLEPKFV